MKETYASSDYDFMKCGYLFGVVRVLKDSHHDEVFVEQNGHVIIRNGRYLCDYWELVAIARSLGVNIHELTLLEEEL